MIPLRAVSRPRPPGHNADVATNGTGDYHIVWRTSGSGDGSGRGLWRTSLGSSDTAVAAPLAVTVNTINDQTEPAIASDGNGDFVITWQGSGSGDLSGVFARRFLSDGTALGSEFRVNQTVAGSQVGASAAVVDIDNFVIAWSGNGSGDATGVFARVYGTMTNEASLLFTTDNNVTASGSPSQSSWTTGDVLALGNPNLVLGENTRGTLSIVGSLNALADDGNVEIEGLDVIQQDVLVGVGADSVQLFRGDVLFSVSSDEMIGGITVNPDDIVVLRPAADLNYASGTLQVLFDGMHSVGGGTIDQMADFDLVDRDTWMGDVFLRAGTLIVSDQSSNDDAIQLFHVTRTGTAVTAGTTETLLKQSDLQMAQEVVGLHFVERDVRLGGATSLAGDLLVSTRSAGVVGPNALAITDHDVVRLNVSVSSLTGFASVTANILVQGADIALDASAESLRALAMMNVGMPPDVQDETYFLSEGGSYSSADEWHLSGWSSRMRLSISNTGRAENLMDFPILVTLDPSRLDYSLAQSGGQDLRFVDVDGTVLAYEIETWDSGGLSRIWVKVPQIDANSNADQIWMYYGNSLASAGQNPVDVWSNGYVGVWHLNTDPSGSLTILDSSSSNVDGSSIGMDSSNRIDGPIGSALQFDGVSEYLRMPTTSTDPTAIDSTQLTIEAWANSTGDTGAAERIVNRRHTVFSIPFQSYGLATSSADRTMLVNSTGTPDLQGTSGSLPEDRWRYVTGVLAGSTTSLYVDGVLNATQTGVTSLGSAEDDITIGAGEMTQDSSISEYWKGGIDEVRLSNVARSAAWTSAQYASMTDRLITYGDRQTVSGLLSNDAARMGGGLLVTRADLSGLTAGMMATVLDDGQLWLDTGTGFESLAAGQTASRQITYSVMDTSGNSDLATATLVIVGVNDAPVLNIAAGPLAFTSVETEALNPSGDSVEDLLGSASGLLISDIDEGALHGIAVTAVDETYGVWEYSLGGDVWTQFTGVSESSATLLDATARIRLIPIAGYDGPGGSITIRAWDQSSGTNGQTGVDTTMNGGSTAFSTQTTTGGITVDPVNLPPVTTVNSRLTVNEGRSVVISSSSLSVVDDQSTAEQITFTVTNPPEYGHLALAASPATVISGFTQQQVNDGQLIYVHNGSEVPTDSFHFITSDGSLSQDGELWFTVNPVNDPPVFDAHRMTIMEGESLTLNSSNLLTNDNDSRVTELVYFVVSISGGRFESSDSPGSAITSFSQDDVDSGRVRFVHNSGEAAPVISLSVSDGQVVVGPNSVLISYAQQNDPPQITINNGLLMNEGTTETISSTRLAASDPDNTATQLVYIVAMSPNWGHLEKSTDAGVSVTTFTQADINGNLIRYVHNGSESSSDSIGFTLSDGSTSVSGAFAITLAPVNDPPAVSMARISVSEGQGVTLSSLNLSTTDTDSAENSLVYTVSGVTNGRFEYLQNSGVSISSFTQDEINGGQVQFVHNGGELAPTATVSVYDGTTRSPAISVEFDFSPVNDMPTISALSNISVQIGQSSPPVSFVVGDAETNPDSLMVEAISSDTSRIPGSSITITGTGVDRAVTINIPEGALPGTVEITLTVSDGILTSSSTFSVNLVGTPTPIATADEYTLREDSTFNSHASGWWDSQWTVRHRLSMNNLERTEALTNFPVLVTLEPGAFDYTQTASNGADLRFVDSDGTLLAHEIETWNSQGVSRVWVNVPRIDGISNSDYLWIYSGNPDALPLPFVNVWGANYEAVYHFSGAPSDAGRLMDSTGNFDGTVVGATSVTGWIGGAYSFDGIDQHIDMPPDSPLLRNASALAFSTWIRPADLTGEQHVLAIGVNTATAFDDSRFSLVLKDNNLEFIVRTIDNSVAARVVTSNGPLIAGQWIYVSWTADLSTNTASLYLNGDLLGTVSNLFLQATTPDTNSSHSSIGAQDSGTSGFYYGEIDEIRLQSVHRSSDWINAEYASMTGSLVTMSGPYDQSGVLDNDTDPQNDTLTAALISGPAHARDFTFNGSGSFTYTPTENYSGEDFFTYQTSDGNRRHHPHD